MPSLGVADREELRRGRAADGAVVERGGALRAEAKVPAGDDRDGPRLVPADDADPLGGEREERLAHGREGLQRIVRFIAAAAASTGAIASPTYGRPLRPTSASSCSAGGSSWTRGRHRR